MKYSALLIALAPAFAFAQSASPILNFEGEITNLTCNVAVNGNTSSPQIALNPAKVADLATPGATAIPTPFTMTLTGCDNSSTANIKLVPTAITAGGNLKNMLTTGQANNVNMQLYNNGGTLALTSAAGVNVPVVIANGTATSQFGVRYVAEGGSAGEGLVKSSVQYAISYQ